MTKTEKPKLRIKIEGIPRGCTRAIMPTYSTATSVKKGMRNIGIRLGVIVPNASNQQLELVFKDCTISYRELPNGEWVTIPPDEASFST